MRPRSTWALKGSCKRFLKFLKFPLSWEIKKSTNWRVSLAYWIKMKIVFGILSGHKNRKQISTQVASFPPPSTRWKSDFSCWTFGLATQQIPRATSAILIISSSKVQQEQDERSDNWSEMEDGCGCECEYGCEYLYLKLISICKSFPLHCCHKYGNYFGLIPHKAHN